MKEAILYEKIGDDEIKCHACSHGCVISDGKRGICGARENQKGKLVSLVYGKTISEDVDPIEKKPLFHFLPGSFTYSYATVGCNLRCDNCQNWQISQYLKLQSGQIIGQKTSPQQIVEQAIKTECQSIAATYTEPSVFVEFALDVMKLSKEKGLKNVWVSNGFMSKKLLDQVIPYLDAINVDLKFYENEKYKQYCGAKLEPILENLKYLKKKGVWTEVTTLIIPELSDQKSTFKKIANFIYRELGEETPWHVSRFSPEISFKLQDLFPTPVEVIKQAMEIGHKQGLKYVYAGNIWNENYENTHCPECKEILINRMNYQTGCFYKKEGVCPKCNYKIDLIL